MLENLLYPFLDIHCCSSYSITYSYIYGFHGTVIRLSVYNPERVGSNPTDCTAIVAPYLDSLEEYVHGVIQFYFVFRTKLSVALVVAIIMRPV